MGVIKNEAGTARMKPDVPAVLPFHAPRAYPRDLENTGRPNWTLARVNRASIRITRPHSDTVGMPSHPGMTM